MVDRFSSGSEPPPDRGWVESVDRSIRQGLALHEWWREAGASRAALFPLHTFSAGDQSFGLLTEVPLAGGPLPVMGLAMEMLFDHPKIPPTEARSAQWLRAQVRELACRYFLKIGPSPEPFQAVAPRGKIVPRVLQPWSWCPSPSAGAGPRFTPVLYRRRPGGEIGTFSAAGQEAPVDSRDVGRVYDWVAARLRYSNYPIHLGAPQLGRLSLQIPLAEEVLVVLSPELQVDREDPEPGVVGEYGIGFTYMPNPAALERPQVQWGFAQTVFRVYENCEVRLRHVAVFQQLTHLLNIEPVVDWGIQVADTLSLGTASVLLNPWRRALGPLASSFDPVTNLADFANAATGGWAERSLGLSRRQLLELVLRQNVQYLYSLYLQLLQVWEIVPDWRDEPLVAAWLNRL